jgi:uncharacterized repeat protein (TIGR03803 family)
MKHSEFLVSTACGLAITIVGLMFAGRAFASSPTETTLYSFLGGSDGANPAAGVVFDKAGNIYGTTPYGGMFNAGTVFELSPPAVQGGAWTEAILYSFTGGLDGQLPSSGLILDGKGALYGETVYGSYDISGTVFKLTPPAIKGGKWTETTLYGFCPAGNPCIDGRRPSGGLVFDKKGNLYGTASLGGNPATGCCGVVFELTPSHNTKKAWTETVLYIFNGGSDGSAPNTGVVFDASGNLYGTTQNGGGCSAYVVGCGVAFELTPAVGAWTESVLYRFQGGTDSINPSGLIFDKSGALYGTAGGGVYNEGSVFKLSPPAVQGGAWTESVLYSFLGFTNGAVDGYTPAAGMILNGKVLFGTTEFGGSVPCGNANGVSGCGTVFRLAPPKSGTGSWTETILWNFASGGAYPAAALTLKGGAFYGTTSGGGNPCQCGAVFELVP